MGVPWSHNDPARGHAADRRRNKGEPRDTEVRLDHNAVAPEDSKEELAVLIGTGPETVPEGSGLHMLDELAELSRTAGARVLGRLYQRLSRPHPGSYLGAGKIEELSDLCVELGANLVIADTDLSPAQVRTLEKALDLRVIDRSELIIDIFARHARTRQAKLQVELAQLEYIAPRLKRMWTHLSRITGAGGIGSTGPGEKQIEVDRRIIQRRISDLKRELAQIEAHRERQVSSRRQTFNVALVGYTNAGKSTLMRAMTGSDVFIADQLFATLDTRTRRCKLGEGLEVLMSDTVGFVEKLPHHLVASFNATLEEVREADLLLHVVDAGDPDADRKVRAVREVLKDLKAHEIPELLILNKVDVLPDPVEATILASRLGAAVEVSALKGLGLDMLRHLVAEKISERQALVTLRVPVTEGRVLALVDRVGRVLSRRYEGEICLLRATVPKDAMGQLRPFLDGEAQD